MLTRNQFISIIGVKAQNDMKETGILASLTISQAILESRNGNSGLTVQANNLFGIKGQYKGKSILMPTVEYTSTGKMYRTNAMFRKYDSWAESIADHSRLFTSLKRYKNLRGETDYKKACVYVQQDGYATDPNYSDLLIKLIEENNLQRFDKIEPIIDISIHVSNLIHNGININFNSWKRSDLIKLQNVPSLLAKLGGIEHLYQDGIITNRDLWYSGKYTVKTVCSLIIKYSIKKCK